MQISDKGSSETFTKDSVESLPQKPLHREDDPVVPNPVLHEPYRGPVRKVAVGPALPSYKGTHSSVLSLCGMLISCAFPGFSEAEARFESEQIFRHIDNPYHAPVKEKKRKGLVNSNEEIFRLSQVSCPIVASLHKAPHADQMTEKPVRIVAPKKPSKYEHKGLVDCLVDDQNK
jgi:hypothetical protein